MVKKSTLIGSLGSPYFVIQKTQHVTTLLCRQERQQEPKGVGLSLHVRPNV